ncbi:hypothetical protein SLA2020_059140 [Shorea laevis]
MVKLPCAVWDEGVKSWEDCLISTFYTDPPNYGCILHMANRVWGRKCSITVTRWGNNSFLFKIPDPARRMWILSLGPWHVAHNTFTMRKGELEFQEAV